MYFKHSYILVSCFMYCATLIMTFVFLGEISCCYCYVHPFNNCHVQLHYVRTQWTVCEFWCTLWPWSLPTQFLLCRLRSIAEYRDDFVRCLSVCPSVCVCLSGSHTFLVVTHSYVSQVTHAFLGMLPLCFVVIWVLLLWHITFSLKQHFCKVLLSVDKAGLCISFAFWKIPINLFIMIQRIFLFKHFVSFDLSNEGLEISIYLSNILLWKMHLLYIQELSCCYSYRVPARPK